MATAGAVADGRLLTAASVGEDVATDGNDQGTRIHKALRRVQSFRIGPEVEGLREKREGRWTKLTKFPEMGKQGGKKPAENSRIGSRD
jgi:hypothetical protein